MIIGSEYIFSKLSKEIELVERQSGKKVLNFGVGNPDFPVNPRYLLQLKKLASDATLFGYPGYGASTVFKQSVIEWYASRFHVNISDLSILPLPGTKYGITHLPLALFQEFDEVLVPNPGYPAYTDTIQASGAKAVMYDMNEKTDFKPDLQNLENICSKRTKFIWLNFPANPTGRMLNVDELAKIVSFSKSHNLTILYDNAYSDITFNDKSAPSILNVPDAQDIAVEFGSFSKSFSMPGLRLGWVVGPQNLIMQLQNLASLYDSGVSMLLQRFGAFILTNPDEAWHDRMINHYEQRRRSIGDFLQSLGLHFVLPDGSLYIWAKIPDQFSNSEEYSMELLATKHILLTPGSAFGENGRKFVRVSVGTDISHLKDYM